MEQFDSATRTTLDKAYEWTVEYLRVLSDTNLEAMTIINAHDVFCRTVLQDTDVRRLFHNSNRLLDEDSELLSICNSLAQKSLYLIAMQSPHRNVENISRIITTVLALIESLRISKIPQTEQIALKV